MMQKKILLAVMAVGVILLFAFVVYQQFVPMRDSTMDDFPSKKVVNPMKPQVTTPMKDEAAVMVPVPATIDGITADITGETALDTSALDKEQTGEASVLQKDSSSVNNLGTTYDPNNL